MYRPLVSVIIPNYNHAKFLDERILSVLNQTYQNFELIILDDKSTDNSVEVINQYKDNPHVTHIVVNEENSGSTFKQWHKGFELAKGEILWIAESDDSCNGEMLDILVKGYVENNAVLAFCRSCKYDIDGNKRPFLHQNILFEDIVMPGKSFISKYMIDRNSVANASSAIFSRNVAMSLHKQYMSMQGEGDWLFWIELMEHGNVCFFGQELNYFRFHNQNTTNTLARKGVGAMEHKIVFDYIVRNKLIDSDDIWKEKLHYILSLLNYQFESKNIKREVLKIWDRYRIFRIYIFLANLKEDLFFFLNSIR